MRDVFSEYYRLTDEAISENWKTGLFVIDANVLLALYRVSKESREDLLRALEGVKNRLWMPYHAALEYQRNRLLVIRDQKNLLPELTKKIEAFLSDLQRGLAGPAAIRPGGELEPVFKSLNECNRHLQKLASQQADVHEADLIRDQIDALLDGRVGQRPGQAEIDEIDKEGSARYAGEIAPGFKDAVKVGTFVGQGIRYQTKYGDLYLWKQTLEHVRVTSTKALFFITNDTKEDWWLKVKGKTIGPHPELRAECLASGAEAFHMYTLAQFLERASTQPETRVRSETIQQVTDLETSTEELAPAVIIYVTQDARLPELIGEVQALATYFAGDEAFTTRYGEDELMVFTPKTMSSFEYREMVAQLCSLVGVTGYYPILHPMTDQGESPRLRTIDFGFNEEEGNTSDFQDYVRALTLMNFGEIAQID